MADDITVDVDATAVLAMFEALGEAAEKHVHDASRITAQRLQQEARARARRRTGLLAQSITVEEAGPPLNGYRVFVAEMGNRSRMFPIWHEFGTRFMSPQSFMYSSAALEEGPHLRLVEEALVEAIEEVNS
jgi:hypothetical protein